jgi:hypothetical protein
MDPITADGDMLALYKQVKPVIVGFSLAFRALWVAQFPERFSDVPKYILKSSYPFSEYKLSHNINNLIFLYSYYYLFINPYLNSVYLHWIPV